jgi:hypothetical protein
MQAHPCSANNVFALHYNPEQFDFPVVGEAVQAGNSTASLTKATIFMATSRSPLLPPHFLPLCLSLELSLVDEDCSVGAGRERPRVSHLDPYSTSNGKPLSKSAGVFVVLG